MQVINGGASLNAGIAGSTVTGALYLATQWTDVTQTGWVPGESLYRLTGPGAENIAPNPAANVTRRIEMITLFNDDSVPHTFGLSYFDGTNSISIFQQDIAAGKLFSFFPAAGFAVQ